MRVLDGIILGVFVALMIVACFFIQCSLDIYFIVLGFAVALMSAVGMILQRRKSNK